MWMGRNIWLTLNTNGCQFSMPMDRDRFWERRALGYLSFLEPYAGVTYLAVCPKN